MDGAQPGPLPWSNCICIFCDSKFKDFLIGSCVCIQFSFISAYLAYLSSGCCRQSNVLHSISRPSHLSCTLCESEPLICEDNMAPVLTLPIPVYTINPVLNRCPTDCLFFGKFCYFWIYYSFSFSPLFQFLKGTEH